MFNSSTDERKCWSIFYTYSASWYQVELKPITIDDAKQYAENSRHRIYVSLEYLWICAHRMKRMSLHFCSKHAARISSSNREYELHDTRVSLIELRSTFKRYSVLLISYVKLGGNIDESRTIDYFLIILL